MTPRFQSGHLFRSHGAWYVRYREPVLEAGVVVTKQTARRIASTTDIPTKAEARILANELLHPLHANTTPHPTMPLHDFVTTVYWKHARTEFAPSTVAGYEAVWRLYIAPHLDTATRLRDFRTWDGERLLRAIFASHPALAKNTLRHIKAFLSGVFKHARRNGYLATPNPMVDVSIPSAAADVGRATEAYSLDEILRMLTLLPEPASTIIGVFGFAGLRKSELRALQPSDYRDAAIYVERSVWEGFAARRTKTKASAWPVPVITPLAHMLDAHIATLAPGAKWLFANANGTPVNLTNLYVRIIRPVLTAAGMKWKGWHAFRRGLATNLYVLGVADMTVQRVLRHDDVATTRKSYIKVPAQVAVEAMQRLETVVKDVMAAGKKVQA